MMRTRGKGVVSDFPSMLTLATFPERAKSDVSARVSKMRASESNSDLPKKDDSDKLCDGEVIDLMLSSMEILILMTFLSSWLAGIAS